MPELLHPLTFLGYKFSTFSSLSIFLSSLSVLFLHEPLLRIFFLSCVGVFCPQDQFVLKLGNIFIEWSKANA